MNSTFQQPNARRGGQTSRKIPILGLLAASLLSLSLGGCLNDDIVPTDDETDAEQTDTAVDATAAADATTPADTGATDSGPTDTGATDTGTTDTGTTDTGTTDTGTTDAGTTDAGAANDAGSATDAGIASDAGTATDAGTSTDAWTWTDAGTSTDAGSTSDSGATADAGTADTGTQPECKTAKDCADSLGKPALCAVWACEAGKCVEKNAAEDQKCDDGDKCTESGTCKGGKCVGKQLACDDNDACTKDSCGQTKGCVHTGLEKTACDDGNPCTDKDICKAGTCAAGEPKKCNDGNPCTTDSCDKAKGCTATPTKTELKPTGVLFKFSHKGPGGGIAVDANGNVIAGHGVSNQHYFGAWDPKGKLLKKAGSPVNGMDELNGEVWVTSIHLKKIYSVKAGAWLLTTRLDTSKWTSLSPKDISFDKQGNLWILFSDFLYSKAAELWQVTTAGKKLQSFKLGITAFAMDVAPSGIYVGDYTNKKVLKFGFDGKAAGSVAMSGQVVAVEADPSGNIWALPYNTGKLSVFDSSLKKLHEFAGPLQSFRIAFGGGKMWVSHAKGATQYDVTFASCDDGNVCTKNDGCTNGKCAGTANNCDDGNVCTKDACKAPGGCNHTELTGTCTDGNACTTGDKCAAKTCKAGPAAKCDDGNSCTEDTCDKSKGCINDAEFKGACDDGDKCTDQGKCNGGMCTKGTAKKCDDGNGCTADKCDANQGCVTTPVETQIKATGKTIKVQHLLIGGLAVDDSGRVAIGHGLSNKRYFGVFKDGKKVGGTTEYVNGMDVYNGVVFAAAMHKQKIYHVDPNTLNLVEEFNTSTWSTLRPKDLSFDAKGNMWIVFSDFLFSKGAELWQVDPSGKKLQQHKLGISSVSIDVAPSGVYVGDLNGKKVHKYGFDGKLLGSANLTGKAYAVEADNAGRIWALGENSGKAEIFDANLKKKFEFSVIKPSYRLAFGKTGKLWVSNVNGAVEYDVSIATCDDGNKCTDAGSCAAGKCSAGSTKSCDDSNPCTVDSCDAAKGCVHKGAAKKPCDDGNPCTTSDLCGFDSKGKMVCAGQVKQCAAGTSCEAKTGKCVDTCTNDKKDGDETDVDCGGSCAKKCKVGQTCKVLLDCEWGKCDGANEVCIAGKTFVVININDKGTGSLRWAMEEANKSLTHDKIHFKIGSGQKIIKLATLLPGIVRNVTIDGRTQPGYKDQPLIGIDVNGMAKGLVGNPGRIELHALVIGNSTNVGVDIGGTGTVISRVDTSWTSGKGMSGVGFQLNGCNGCRIDTVKAANRKTGIRVHSGTDISIVNADVNDSGDCGVYGYGVAISSVKAKKLVGGVHMRKNMFGGTSKCGLALFGGTGVVISSKDEAGTSIHLNDDSGIQHTRDRALMLNGTVDTKVTGINLSSTASAAYQGTGLQLTKTIRTVVDGVDFTGRGSAFAANATDTTLINSTFKDTGPCSKFSFAVNIGGMTSQKLPGGFKMSGNVFGGTTKCVIRMVAGPGLTVSSDPKVGHIVLGGADKSDEASGTVFQGVNVSNVSFKGLDVSFSGKTRKGVGVHLYGSGKNNTFTAVRAEGRELGVDAGGANTSSITCSRFADNKVGLGASGAMTCKNNVFEGNTTGLKGSIVGAALDATKNWWGDPSGSKTDKGKGDTHGPNVKGTSPLTKYPDCAPTKKTLN